MKRNDRRRADRRGELTPDATNVSAEFRSTLNEPPRPGDRLRAFFEFGLTATIVSTLFFAPEASIREGDYLPIALVFFGFAAGLFLLTLRAAIRSNVDVSRSSTDARVPNSAEPPASAKRRITVPLIADVALAVYLVCATVSYLRTLATGSGDAFAATNAYWTFATPPLLYFVVRRFRAFVSRRFVVALCGALFAAAIAESAYSAYSYAVVNPRLRAEYRADPNGMLEANGMRFAPDSRERSLFEKRLLDSTEPVGTYGLANTLAGFLTPLFVLGLFAAGVVFKTPIPDAASRVRIATRLTTAFFLILIAFALVATKSRAGCLATAFGAALWATSLATSSTAAKTPNRKSSCAKMLSVLAGAILVVGALIGAFATGLIDREVFSEAGKSFGYRLDYWRASAAIVRDNPLFGIGPGEFQSVYAQYISPTASEFVADPHNLAFELAALFGLPALVAFAVFLAATFAAAFGKRNVVARNEFSARPGIAATFVGAAVGIAIAVFCSLAQTAILPLSFVGFAVASVAAVGWGTRVWLKTVHGDAPNGTDPLPPFAFAAAIAAATLNLCAAGGIGYPTISTLIFLFGAFVVDARIDDEAADSADVAPGSPKLSAESRRPIVGRKAALVGSIASLALLVVFATTALRPRTANFLFALRCETPYGADVYRPLLENADFRALGVRSTQTVSQVYFATAKKYADAPTPKNRERWNAARNVAKRFSPNSAATRESFGDFDFSLYSALPANAQSRAEFLTSALDFYREAAEKSPTDVVKREKLVRAARAANDRELAREHALRALELDAGTSHEDRKLTPEGRDELTRFLESAK